MSTDILSIRSAWSDSPDEEPSIQSLVCPKCNSRYPNIHELLIHQGSKGHFACDECDVCFYTRDGLHGHKRKDHRPTLDLECFGCHSHFQTAARFWRHLESGECKVIYPSDIARLRDNNLQFAIQLDLRRLTLVDVLHGGASHIKAEDTWAVPDRPDVAPTRPNETPDFPSRPAPISANNAHPLYYRSEDFPSLPTKRIACAAYRPDGVQKENVWSDHKAASEPHMAQNIPNLYSSVPPPSSYEPIVSASKGIAQRPIPNSKIRVLANPSNTANDESLHAASSGRIIDPYHPDYTPSVFHNEILEMFVCPHNRCGKKFGNAFGLTGHLKSPAHVGGNVSCIRCRKSFATVADLIGHMETSIKCPIRETDGFRTTLGHITGGILDFHRRAGIFLIDEKSVKKLLEMRSKSKV